MKGFWTPDHPWLFGFLTGLIVAVLMFHFRLQADHRHARPVTPYSAPRWIQTPAKTQAADALKTAAWHAASQSRNSNLKENERSI